MFEDHPEVERAIRSALEEDLGQGDVTTGAVVDPVARGEASLVTRARVVLAGLPVFERVFTELSRDILFEAFYGEGEWIPEGSRVCTLKGPLGPILKGERTALNFLQRMSGIATLTRKYVEKAGGTRARILDTRKTAPGLRWFDKRAVRVGGGWNHRFGLSDGILIKDNHIAAAGSIARAVGLVRDKAPHTLRVEVEVETLAGVEEALKAGADIILLDNMDPVQMAQAVKLVQGRAKLEASGGITLETVQEVAHTGVDFISVGALTHSPRAADFSLEIVSRSGPDEQ